MLPFSKLMHLVKQTTYPRHPYTDRFLHQMQTCDQTFILLSQGAVFNKC